MSMVEERKTIRDAILKEFQEALEKTRAAALHVDKEGAVAGGTTQEKIWNAVKALEEAEANLTQESQTHP
ncbi:hypothetical protein BV898_18604 [Hypsibius exemplaris]|uniref:Uncharacterized protein n=1 Tax=Hypsibius exemplaris TaxID=2072580 RepID=A0A9X6NPF5_HYPEX|nr:hypothetical protein BV898_18604 [Hypsibius exemplaris]